MNKIFKVIYNRSSLVWSVVSELARGHSKSSSVSSLKKGAAVLGALFVAPGSAYCATASDSTVVAPEATPVIESAVPSADGQTVNLKLRSSSKDEEHSTESALKDWILEAERDPLFLLGSYDWGWSHRDAENNVYEPRYKRSDNVFVRSYQTVGVVGTDEELKRDGERRSALFDAYLKDKKISSDELGYRKGLVENWADFEDIHEVPDKVEVRPEVKVTKTKEPSFKLELTAPKAKTIQMPDINSSFTTPQAPKITVPPFEKPGEVSVSIKKPDVVVVNRPQPVSFFTYSEPAEGDRGCYNSIFWAWFTPTKVKVGDYGPKDIVTGFREDKDENTDKYPASFLRPGLKENDYSLFFTGDVGHGTRQRWVSTASSSGSTGETQKEALIYKQSWGGNTNPLKEYYETQNKDINIDSINIKPTKDGRSEITSGGWMFDDEGEGRTVFNVNGSEWFLGREDLPDALCRSSFHAEWYNPFALRRPPLGAALGKENFEKIRDRNRQDFLMGVSRGMELSSGNSGGLPPGAEIHMAGPLVIGINAHNGYANTAYNFGTITDKGEPAKLAEEMDQALLEELSTKGKTFLGPRVSQKYSTVDITSIDDYEPYFIKSNQEGYLGYKSGMAVTYVSERSRDEDGLKIQMRNFGDIDLYGPHSVGMLMNRNQVVDLTEKNANQPQLINANPAASPNYEFELQSVPGRYDGAFDSSENMKKAAAGSKGTITMHGAESFGMKWQVFVQNLPGVPNPVAFRNEGDVVLRRNGMDGADKSVGMGMVNDSDFMSSGKGYSVSLPLEKAENSGRVILDGVSGSVGLYSNAYSNFVNSGEILLKNGPAACSSGEACDSVGMFAEQTKYPFNKSVDQGKDWRSDEQRILTSVVNRNKIDISQSRSVGMVAAGISDDPNQRNITGHYKVNATNEHSIVFDNANAQGGNNSALSGIRGMLASNEKPSETGQDIRLINAPKGRIEVQGQATDFYGMALLSDTRGENFGVINGPDVTNSYGIYVQGNEDYKKPYEASSEKRPDFIDAGTVKLSGDENVGVYNNGFYSSDVSLAIVYDRGNYYKNDANNSDSMFSDWSGEKKYQRAASPEIVVTGHSVKGVVNDEKGTMSLTHHKVSVKDDGLDETTSSSAGLVNLGGSMVVGEAGDGSSLKVELSNPSGKRDSVVAAYNKNGTMTINSSSDISVDGKHAAGFVTVTEEDSGKEAVTTLTNGKVTVNKADSNDVAIGIVVNGEKARTVLGQSGNAPVEFEVNRKGYFAYASNSGTIEATGRVNVTLNAGGTGFYLKKPRVDDGKVKSPLIGSNGINFTLNSGSALAVLDTPQGGEISASNAGPSPMDNVNITSTQRGHTVFYVLNGRLVYDKSIIIDDNREIQSSNSHVRIANGTEITSTAPNSLAFYQAKDENYSAEAGVEVGVFNSGTITMNGGGSTAVAGQAAKLHNDGVINLEGTNSYGIFGARASEVVNTKTGKINLNGEGAVGMYSTNFLDGKKADDIEEFAINISNAGEISSTAPNAVGMVAINHHLSKSTSFNDWSEDVVNGTLPSASVSNAGTIALQKEGSIGMYVENIESTPVSLGGTGTINVGEGSVSVKAVDSVVTADPRSQIGIGGGSIAYDLTFNKELLPSSIKSSIEGTVTVTPGAKRSAIFVVRSESDLGAGLLEDDVTIRTSSPDAQPSYVFMDFEHEKAGLSWTYKSNHVGDKALHGLDSFFLTSNNAKLEYGGNNELVGTGWQGLSMVDGGIHLAAGSRLSINGDDGIAVYGSGTEINNEGALQVKGGTHEHDSYAIYAIPSETQESTLKGIGKISLGNYSTGVYYEFNKFNTLNLPVDLLGTASITVKPEDTPEHPDHTIGSRGLILKNLGAQAATWTNQGRKLNLEKSDGALGIGLLGKFKYTNAREVIVGGSTLEAGTVRRGVALYADDPATVITNSAPITAGNGSVGVAGHAVTTDLNSKISVGQSGIGIYSLGGPLNLSGSLSTGEGDLKLDNKELGHSVGVYHKGAGNAELHFSSLVLGNASIGYFEADGDDAGKINSAVGSVELGSNSTYIWSRNANKQIASNTRMTAREGKYVTGIRIERPGSQTNPVKASEDPLPDDQYQLIQSGAIDFEKAKGSVGVLADGANALMSGEWVMGPDANGHSSVAMIARNGGRITNRGKIRLAKDKAVGLYAADEHSVVVNEKEGNIEVSGKNAVGIYLGEGATAVNRGEITVSGPGAIGVYLSKGSVIKNYGKFTIHGGSVGVYDTAEKDQSVAVETNLKLEETIGGQSKKGEVTCDLGGEIYHNPNIGQITEKGTGTMKVELSGGLVKVTYPVGEPVIGYVNTKDPSNVADNLVEVGHLVNGEPKITLPPLTEAEVKEIVGEDASQSAISMLGMYIDTSGLQFTKPIDVSPMEKVTRADLIVGSEASNFSSNDVIVLGENILKPYKEAIQNKPNIFSWNLVSGSYLWNVVSVKDLEGVQPSDESEPGTGGSGTGSGAGTGASGSTGTGTSGGGVASHLLDHVLMVRVPFQDTAPVDSKMHNFLVGLDEMYGKTAPGSKRKLVFNKLMNIGKNEALLYQQAMYEMIGQDYATVPYRLQMESNRFADEWRVLDHWTAAYKGKWSAKLFGGYGHERFDRPGLINYNHNVQGIVAMKNDAGHLPGQFSGPIFGFSHNAYEFKDAGRSKETSDALALGYFLAMPLDEAGTIRTVVKGGLEGSLRRYKRHAYIVDEKIDMLNKYASFGAFVESDLTKTFRLTPTVSVEPGFGVDFGWRRTTGLNSESGDFPLDIRNHKGFWVEPHVGVTLRREAPFKNGLLASSLAVDLVHHAGENRVMGYRSQGASEPYSDYLKSPRASSARFTGRVSYDGARFGVGMNASYDVHRDSSSVGVEARIRF